MTVKTLGLTHSLDVLWSELVYTEARLLRDKVARDLAPLFVALLRRWEKIANGQRAVWRAEIVAQAGVDLQNLALDETVELIADALWLAEGKDRTTPRYRRYFAKPPSAVIRLGLENELPVVRDWVSSLTTEPELALRELGTRLEADIAAGDLAIGERRDALTANRNHRLREINGLVHEINETRQSDRKSTRLNSSHG